MEHRSIFPPQPRKKTTSGAAQLERGPNRRGGCFADNAKRTCVVSGSSASQTPIWPFRSLPRSLPTLTERANPRARAQTVSVRVQMEKSGTTLGALSLLSEGKHCPSCTLNPTVIEPTEGRRAKKLDTVCAATVRRKEDFLWPTFLLSPSHK